VITFGLDVYLHHFEHVNLLREDRVLDSHFAARLRLRDARLLLSLLSLDLLDNHPGLLVIGHWLRCLNSLLFCGWIWMSYYIPNCNLLSSHMLIIGPWSLRWKVVWKSFTWGHCVISLAVTHLPIYLIFAITPLVLEYCLAGWCPPWVPLTHLGVVVAIQLNATERWVYACCLKHVEIHLLLLVGLFQVVRLLVLVRHFGNKSALCYEWAEAWGVPAVLLFLPWEASQWAATLVKDLD